MKIYTIENGKTVGEVEVASLNKEIRFYCFFVKDYFFKYCALFWINHYNSDTKKFYSLKRH